MSRRSVGLFLAGFAVVSVVSFRETALARFRRFHASACASDSSAPTYGLPADAADSKASGVLYGRTNKAVQLLCSVEDSSEFKVADMKILKVFVNDGNMASKKDISARWCWSAVKGWTGACGSAKSSVGKVVGTPASAPAGATPTPPEADTTEELVWDDSDGLNPADHPWAGMRPTGFAYVYVQVPGKATGTDLSLGFVGLSVYDAP